MQRVFCRSGNISANIISLADRNLAHHLKDVLRVKENSGVIACDESGNEYGCVVTKLTGQCVELTIKNITKNDHAGKTKITVACALPKKSRFDDILDKLTQLGTDRIIPLQTERVIVKFYKEKEKSRYERWNKIVLSASEQSRRKTLPVVEPVMKLEDVLKACAGYDLKLIPALIGERKALPQILAGLTPRNILVLIGPEGDFSPREVALAVEAGCVPVTLGEQVLRVETAAVSVVSMLNYALKWSPSG